MHLVCPRCGTTNRVRDDALDQGPVCGSCRTLLLAAEPVALAPGALEHFIAATDLPVVVDFWAQWCGPCKMMAPHFAEAARQRPTIRHAKVDTEADPEAAARHRIRGIPTMILFQAGREVARTSGAMTSAQILGWVARNLSSPS
jgi:thioredoxin 2